MNPENVRIRLKHLKLKPFHFLSQLDIARLWDRVIRRTSLPLAFSQGFNPRPRISFGPALALGIQSFSEYVELTFQKPVSPERVFFLCRRELPNEMRPVEAIKLLPSAPGLIKATRGITYRFIFTGSYQERPVSLETPWLVEWDKPVLARNSFMLSFVFIGKDIQLSPIKFSTYLKEQLSFPSPTEIIKANVLFES